MPQGIKTVEWHCLDCGNLSDKKWRHTKNGIIKNREKDNRVQRRRRIRKDINLIARAYFDRKNRSEATHASSIRYSKTEKGIATRKRHRESELYHITELARRIEKWEERQAYGY